MITTSTHPAPRSGGSTLRWLIPVAVVLAACTANGGSDDSAAQQPPAAEVTAPAGAAPADETSPEPKPEPVGFGPGVWEVDTEIPAGTYVTVASQSCYWARLSGFSGSFDDIIANDNLSRGARGRVAISDDDAGIEFSGGCEWVEVSDATPIDVGDEVGDGVWAVGDEVSAGTYTTDASGSCYWARLSGFSGSFDDIIANGNIGAGSRGRVEISGSDTGIEFSGGCVWTRN